MTLENFGRRSSLPCLAPRRWELVCEDSLARFRNLEKAFIFGRALEENESVNRTQELLPFRVLVQWRT